MKHILLSVLFMNVVSLSAKPIIIAHRGASGHQPENTLLAFETAIEMGAPMIELDVHVCKSGELVVVHDNQIDKKNITALTWEQLQKYDMGNGQRIPLLSQVLDLVNKRAVVNIELKGHHTAQPVAKLIINYINNKQWTPDYFLVTSFDHYHLKEFQSYAPHIKTGTIFECNPIGYAQITANAKAQYAIMQYDWVTEEFIADAHGRNIHVYAYTVNSKDVAQKLQKMNIDGIITNYPDILR